MENKRQILELCLLHDEIKNSQIRKMGIENPIFLPKVKDRYDKIMRDFYNSVIDYFEDFKDLDEIKKTFIWMKNKNYDLSEIGNSLDECYVKYEDDEFIAALDFLVFSKLHCIIEYIYYLSYDKHHDKNFKHRLNDN